MAEGEGVRLPSSPPSSPLPVIPLTGYNEERNDGREPYEREAVPSDEHQMTSSPPVLPFLGEIEVMNKAEEKAQEKVSNGDLTDELRAQIIRQVEYYFSDENLPTDKFMLKFVKKDKGFVPIGVIASFRKMKKLVKDDVSIVVAALRTSTNLVVNSDGKKVRRSNPLQIVSNMTDAKLRTVLVENLQENYSEESINKLFSPVGKILNLKIQGPQSEEGSMYGKNAMMSNKIHALVEYSSVEEAEKAVVMLNDTNNWRKGIRVELLHKRKGFGKFEKFATKDKHAGIGDGNKDDVDHASIAKENRGHNKNRQKFHIQKDAKEIAGTIGSSSEITIKPLPGPRMPDGTRGFTMGRGKPLKF